jgi:hypothetical protein
MALGTGNGTLLDTLVVKIEVDLSGFRRGIAQARSEIRGLASSLSGAGGFTLGDAVNAALTAPLLLASARIGQVRNEMRLLTTEMRRAAQIGVHPGGGVPAPWAATAGAVAPYALGGAVLDMQRRQGRDERGRFTPSRYRAPGDDRDTGAGGAGGGAIPPIIGAPGGPAGPEDDDGRGGRRRRNWFQRTFSSTRARRAFQVGQREFPGFGAAADDLGVAAYNTGRAVRGAAGGRIAQALGLTGLGTLVSSLIPLLSSLATLVGGTLAGAFAALMTPIGLVVAAVAAFLALFVAANWEPLKEFATWVQDRWNTLMGEAFGDILSGAGDAWSAFVELFNTLWNDEGGIKKAFLELGEIVIPILKLFVEIILRVFNAAGEAIGGFLHILAEFIRTITALIQGDWAGAWQHAGEIVHTFYETIKNIFSSLLPEISEPWRQTWAAMESWVVEKFGQVCDWVGEKLKWLGDQFAQLYDRVVGHSYVPDMVDGIAEQFGRLQDVMVEPCTTATRQVTSAFQQAADDVLKAIGSTFKSGLRTLINGGDLSLTDMVKNVVFGAGRAAGNRASDNLWGALGGILGGAANQNDGGFWSGVIGGIFGSSSRTTTSGSGGGNLGNSIGLPPGVLNFGGGRAAGGFVLPNTIVDVGELGPEKLIMGPRGGYVAPNARNDNRRGGGTNVYNFNFPPGTDARSFQQSRGQLEAMLARTTMRGRRYS